MEIKRNKVLFLPANNCFFFFFSWITLDRNKIVLSIFLGNRNMEQKVHLLKTKKNQTQRYPFSSFSFNNFIILFIFLNSIFFILYSSYDIKARYEFSNFLFCNYENSPKYDSNFFFFYSQRNSWIG